MEPLATLAENPVLAKALKEKLLARFDEDFSLTEQLTNAQLGERTRARLQVRRAVEAVFRDIESLKSAPQSAIHNRAR